MKKSFVVILVLIAVVTAAIVAVAIFRKPENKNNENIVAGGWSKVSSPVITEDLQKVFDKAARNLTGESYEAVAYLETQVVAGRNHLFLCKGTPTVPDAETVYSLVTVYERLDGYATITSVSDSNIVAVETEENVDGGWVEEKNTEVTGQVKTMTENINKTLTGARLHPVAILGTQHVQGVRYALLCEMIPTVPDAASHYAVAYVYEDANGNAQLEKYNYIFGN